MGKNCNFKQRGRPVGQKNSDSHHAGRPKKKESKTQSKINFKLVNKAVGNGDNLISSSTAAPAIEQHNTVRPTGREEMTISGDDQMPLGEQMRALVITPSEEDEEEILDEIDETDDYEEAEENVSR